VSDPGSLFIRFQKSKERGFDVGDANPWYILVAGIGLLTMIGLALVGLSVIYTWRMSRMTPDRGLPGYRHGAHSRTSIEADRAEMDRETDGHLHRYRWIDADKGVVQIPIERAMEIIAKEAEEKP
jgi:hypothetical protein